MTSFSYQPPRPDRKIKTMVGRSISRKADRTMEHLARGWLPVNPAVLKHIREGLASGEYNKDREALVAEIKKDPNLFLYCVKSLPTVVDDPKGGIDPFAALRVLEEEKLNRVFAHREGEISIHRARDATAAQLLRFQHAVISTRTAEKLAESHHTSSDLAFSAAALRQLGHSLLSWNYPEIYAKALLNQRTHQVDLDIELQRLLGISPLQIGQKLANEWNTTPDLRRAVNSALPKDTGLQANPASLESIIKHAELFAKAQDPEHFPKAIEAWEKLAPTLAEQLGVDIEQIVKPSVQESFSLYDEALHKQVRTHLYTPPQNPHEFDMSERARKRLANNQFIKRCEPVVRLEFENIYKKIGDTSVSIDALRALVDSLIPKLGFRRGCVYLSKKESSALVPALRIGDRELNSYRSFRGHETHPVPDAVNTTIPLLRHIRDEESGEDIVKLYAGLGSEQHEGVLELELLEQEEAKSSQNTSLLFRAARQTLVDCLE